jgi:hypothetical protein
MILEKFVEHRMIIGKYSPCKVKDGDFFHRRREAENRNEEESTMATMSFEEKMSTTTRALAYEPGDKLTIQLKDIDEAIHEVSFDIESFCGGGFAGQVYRGSCSASADGFLKEGQPYAIKIYRPRSGFRRRFRDVMYWMGFQSPFPYHYDEDAARTILYLSEILKDVCKVEFGSSAPINECYGTFWSDHVGAYGEINEWVHGGVTDPALDSEILVRKEHNKRMRSLIREGKATEQDLMVATDEVTRKHEFMDRLVVLCNELGLEDISRQVYWWTGASQPNVFIRKPSKTENGLPDFVWLDRRPGLPGFITSPGDFILLPKAILRGSLPPFDRINFKKLRAWAKAPDRQRWDALLDRLEELDRRYRDGQLDLFGHHVRLIYDGKLLRSIWNSRLNCWKRAERIDARTQERLKKNSFLMLIHIFVVLIPFLGRHLQKIIGNGEWRKCIADFFFDGNYRSKVFFEARAYRIKIWLLESRITLPRAKICYHHLGSYLKDWLFYFWMPPTWQLFFTDQAFQWDMLRRLFTSPFKYIFLTSYRGMVNTQWIKGQTLEDVKKGYVSEEEADRFTAIAGDRPLQQYITGILYTAAVKPVSEVSYLIGFIAYLTHIVEAFKSLGWAMGILAAFLLLLISPAGVLRFIYSVIMGILNPRVPYLAAIVCAPVRGLGDLAFPIQMGVTYPAFSTYLLTSSLCKLVQHVPVFGERGGLLSIWSVTVFLSWPASFKAWWHYCRDNARACKSPEVNGAPIAPAIEQVPGELIPDNEGTFVS